jgi:hypothetical protein
MRSLVALFALSLPTLTPQTVLAIPFTSVADYANLPDGMNFGDVAGVTMDSKGHVFAFSRSNIAAGPVFGAAAAQLFEFDQDGNFMREIAKASMHGHNRIAFASTKRTISGRLTKVPI